MMEDTHLCLQSLVILRRAIFHDILYATFEDDAEIIDGGCVQWLIFTELVDGRTGNVMILDERIGRLGRLLQRCPESVIYDHRPTPLTLFGEYIVFYGWILDYSRNIDYNNC